MATWTRYLVANPELAGTADTSLSGIADVEDGTEPGDFAGATINSVRIVLALTGTGFADDTWDVGTSAVYLATSGGTDLATITPGTDAGNGNETATVDLTDSSPNATASNYGTGLNLGASTGASRTWATYVAEMKADGGTIDLDGGTASFIVIDYTPDTSISGSLAETEAADTSTASGVLKYSGTVAVTDDADEQSGAHHITFDGTVGNYASVPDSAALDITGDIDLIAYVNPTAWTQAASEHIISKLDNPFTGGYILRLASDSSDKVALVWHDGTSLTTVTSTVAVPFSDGDAAWIRATLDVDNGASGYDVKFYTSTDAPSTAVGSVSWTQLGATVTGGATTSIAANAQALGIGAFNVPAAGVNPFDGDVYRVAIRNGYDGAGTVQLDADFTDLTFSEIVAGSFTEDSTNSATVTLTGSAWTYTYQAEMGIVGSAAVTEQADEQSSAHGLTYDGTTGNWASAPDIAAYDITGDIDLRAAVSLDDWTPVSDQALVAKWNTGQDAYALVLDLTGELIMRWADSAAIRNAQSSTTVPVSDGQPILVRATLDVDNGSSSHDVTFYTKPFSGATVSADLASDTGWVQLGTVQQAAETSAVTAIDSTAANMQVGNYDNGTTIPLIGTVYGAVVKDGIGGTTVFDADFTDLTFSEIVAGSFTEDSSNAATVTLNGSAWTYTYQAEMGVVGSLAETEGADTSAASGTVTGLVTGTVAVTEGADTSSASGESAVTGSLAVTEGADTSSASGESAVTGSLAVTEGADTSAASGTLGYSGSLAETEGADTSAASGTYTAPPITGTLAVTEAADTLAAAGVSAQNIGSVNVTEQADTSAASGTLGYSGSLAETEGADSLAASGESAVTGSAGPSEQADTLAASGESVVTGSAAIVEAADQLTAAGQAVITAAAAVLEGVDTSSATGSSLGAFTGSAAVTEAADQVSAAGTIPDPTTGLSQEGKIVAGSSASSSIVASSQSSGTTATGSQE